MPTKKTKQTPPPQTRDWTAELQRKREDILRPELFTRPRNGNLLNPVERRKSDARALIGKYLELADTALSSSSETDARRARQQRREN